VAGYAFALHGAQKLFGVLGFPEPASPMSLLGLAGIIELVGGALIAIGFLTSWTAVIASGEMAVAYFLGHVRRSGIFLFPLQNQGELAVLYCFLWLYFASRGAGIWSVDQLIWGRGA
jgi:putative oxidoreductase